MAVADCYCNKAPCPHHPEARLPPGDLGPKVWMSAAGRPLTWQQFWEHVPADQDVARVTGCDCGARLTVTVVRDAPLLLLGCDQCEAIVGRLYLDAGGR